MAKKTIDALMAAFKGKQTAKAIFARDDRIKTIRVYHDGWLPNAYGWPAPGKSTEYSQTPEGDIVVRWTVYDRKRPHAAGPKVVALSEKSGRLYSC